MIRLISLTADYPQFKTVQLQPGFNILLAERTLEATELDSRNGLGKTTFIALIDFCLGANVGDRMAPLTEYGWTFSLTMQTSGYSFVVSRSLSTPGDVRVDGPLDRLRIIPSDANDVPASSATIGVGAWRDWLGQNAFELASLGRDHKPPTYRGLIKHFVRFRLDSFVKPFTTFANQPAWQVQLENTFLLDLDWRLAVGWAQLQETKRRLALVDDPDDGIEDQIGALEAQLIRQSRRATALRRQFERFEILPEYKDVERHANSLTTELKSLANENVTDLELLEMYQARAVDEGQKTSVDVAALFAEAGVVLGEHVVRTLSATEEFYAAVTKNRAEYLRAEVETIAERIRLREARQRALATQQREALALLQEHGALEDFTVLQRSLATAEASVAEIEARLGAVRELRKRTERVKAMESDLRARSVSDLDERFELRSDVISRFGEILDLLYGEPADLEVALGKTGFRFRTALPRNGSSGVQKMAIFAYDIAIVEQLTRGDRGPGFLIHDSTMFDGVDERQVAHALDIAATSAHQYGYQYITAMNSDAVPWRELADEESFRASIALTLTDSAEDGGLLGLRIHDPSPVESFDSTV